MAVDQIQDLCKLVARSLTRAIAASSNEKLKQECFGYLNVDNTAALQRKLCEKLEKWQDKTPVESAQPTVSVGHVVMKFYLSLQKLLIKFFSCRQTMNGKTK